MMSFSCAECGYRTIKSYGRCPNCGAWDSISEDASEREADSPSAPWIGESVRQLSQIDLADVTRRPSGLSEFDRVLGGGLIPGGVILFGGEPGIGKSTLLLQVAQALAERDGNVLFVSGEESESQIKLRASRLGIDGDRLYLLAEQSLPRIVAAVEEVEPCCLIIDSIQTVRGADPEGGAGSLRQLRGACAELIRLAKTRRLVTFLVGHITKEGSFAGPKTIEHLVDVAVYLEGSRGEDVRILRSVKNRFGPTNEAAVFRMTENGLIEIDDPSSFFLEAHGEEARSGSVIVSILEGSRPILIELQALVSPTGGYGVPQRRCTGLDVNRVLLLLAVIEKRLAVHAGGADVYLSVAGGLQIRERAADLGIVVAIVSSLRNRAIQARTTVSGEVGLSGEIRAVRRLTDRIGEAKKMGYERIVVPATGKTPRGEGIDVIPVESIDEAIASLGLG
ncbi:MAG: DNA repair protein RadA [Candidatus Bipolaricaulia bacterium]